MISKVKRETEISCSAFIEDHLSPDGHTLPLTSIRFAASVFSIYLWANKRLVTRHLFAVSGRLLPSQKIEFGSKPAGL